MKKRNLPQTTDHIMSYKLIWFVIISMFILCGSLVVGVGHEMIEQEAQSTDQTMDALQNTQIDSKHDWKIWEKNSLLNDDTEYVHIHGESTKHGKINFYSPNTKELIEDKLFKIPFTEHLYYNDDSGILYYQEASNDDIHFDLWTSMEYQTKLLKRIIVVCAIIFIVSVLVSIIYIRLITVQLTEPLSRLTYNVQEQTKNHTRNLLPVPSQPLEVYTLATTFNALIKQLNRQYEKEKSFISNATHQLKTPIATIKSNVQLIERHGKEHPEIIERSLKYIGEESNIMQKLIDQLLMLSKNDQLKMNFKKYNLSQELKYQVEKLQSNLKQQLILDSQEDLFITADEALVNQIIINVVSNAGKYSPANSTIQLHLFKNENNLPQLDIIDEGSGISDEDKKHIFERFYRSSSVRGKIKGTGLGLTLAFELAKLNNINILVADNHPQGTIFTLIFYSRK